MLARGSAAADLPLRFPAPAYYRVSQGLEEVAGESEEDDAVVLPDGAWAAYGPVELDDVRTLKIRVATGHRGGLVEVRAEGQTGPSLAALTLEDSSGETGWATYTTGLSPMPGSHALYLVFSAPTPEGSEVVVDWLELVPRGS